MKQLLLSSAAVAMSVTASVAAAQTGAPLQVGEILENGGGQQVKVLQCRPVVYGRECQTVAWVDGRADSNPSWWDELMLIKGDARVREAMGKPPRGGVAPVATPKPTPRPMTAPARPVPTAPPPHAAPGGRIPDGTYRCQMWMGSSYVSLGTVRAVGGKLNADLLGKVGATFTGATATADGVTISYTTARGYRESMDCKRA